LTLEIITLVMSFIVQVLLLKRIGSKCYFLGITTFSITTLCIMTLSIMALSTSTLSIPLY
jgi:hypothetical protein